MTSRNSLIGPQDDETIAVYSSPRAWNVGYERIFSASCWSAAIKWMYGIGP
jgi:hypothetical protein